ncbi:MAG: hypothetical protein J6W42_00805 [Bacteroidaceae bacterium]|nr:hypothetical protein [Bacteroidaceae bacterium]
MGLGITNILIVSKYETKLLVRGWFFKVFAFLAVFTAIILGAIYILTQFPQPEVVNRSVIPYMFLLIMNVGQAVVSVFLASEYLKRDKQLDTSEVFYTRPLSNAEYLIGKMWATLKVFFILDFAVAMIALIMSLIKFGFALDYLSYLWYFLLLSVPTLVFIVGLSTTLMLILNNQAITMVILLAYIGVTLFYIDNLYYYLFDYIGFNLPMLKSVVTGFSGLSRLINHRMCYLLLGIGLILTDVSLFHRLANSRYSLLPWRIAAAVFLAGGLYAGYRHVHMYKVDEKYRADMVELDNKYVHIGGAVARSCELTVTQSGDSLSVRADMTVSPKEDASQLVFTLNPGFRINSITAPGHSMKYERLMHLIILTFDATLPEDEPLNLIMEYGGMADERICYLDISAEKLIENVKALSRLNVGKRYLFQDREYTMLTPESYWYPRPGVAYSDQSPEWQMSYFTDFTVNVTPNPGLKPISQGLCTANEDSTSYSFKPESSLPSISLLIGDYNPKSITVDSTLYTVWELGHWDDQFEVFDSIRDTVPYIIRDRRRNMEYQADMAYPFKRFQIVEVPVQFTSYKRVWTSAYEQLQPEMALVHERGFDMREFQFRNMKRSWTGRNNWNRRNNNMSEKEILVNILINSINFMMQSGNMSGSSRNGQWTMTQVDNPYFYRPLFYNFRYNVYSSDWPMANRMVESMTAENNARNNNWMRRMNGLSEDEKALILMGKYDFDRIMSDPEWEDLADNALELKTKDFFAPVSVAVGYESLVDSLSAKTRERAFANVSFDSILDWVQSYSGISLEDKIEAWNGTAQLACYKIGTPQITTVTTDTADIYQAEVTFENISDNPGFVNVEFVFYETENAGDEDKPTSMMVSVGPHETRRIVTHWFNIPSYIRVNTMLSSNLPHEINLNNTDWSTFEGTELTAEGVYNVRGGVDNTLPGEIIVDNEDSNLFSLSRPLRTGYLSKWIDKAKEKKNEFMYEGFSDWRTYSQWTLVTDQNLYGDYIRSAYLISPGDGGQYARWSIPLEVAGVYDVYYYAAPNMYENNNRNRRWNNNNNNNWNNNNNNGRRVTNDYNFEIGQFNTSDHVSMNMWRAEEGWNLLGTFRFEADTVRVTLNNRSGIRIIVADAVRLVKRER